MKLRDKQLTSHEFARLLLKQADLPIDFNLDVDRELSYENYRVEHIENEGDKILISICD